MDHLFAALIAETRPQTPEAAAITAADIKT